MPGSPYVSQQTRYILVRFVGITPAQVTNLASGFISVSGAQSGLHTGTARVASDGKTVMFVMETYFAMNELVTVTLNPQVEPGAAGNVQPYQYQFMVTAPMPGTLPLAVRGAYRSDWATLVSDDAITQPPPAAPSSRLATKAVLMSNGVSVPSDFPQVVITSNTNPSPGDLFLESLNSEIVGC